MRQRTEHSQGDAGKRALCAVRARGALGLIAAIASLAFAATAAAAPTPPFNQCPAVGFDTSCAVLIVINAQGGLESYVDPSQGPYEGANDQLVGVQNNSASTVTSIVLKGTELFDFDGDGLCSGENESGEGGFQPPPEGCPFGPTGYEGPNTSFTYDPEDPDEGTVNFLSGTIAAGGSAYFSLDAMPGLNCAETACEATSASTELSDGVQSGSAITVPYGTAVTDTATLSGPNASVASGYVHYSVYSDSACQDLYRHAGDVTVNGPSVPASEPMMLPSGTYYWRAEYSGDSHNASSASPCGAEVETVSAPPPCTKLAGVGKYGSGSSLQGVNDNVNTSLAGKQVFNFKWQHGAWKLHMTHLTSATCDNRGYEQIFTGRGTAKLNKVPGYEVFFSVATTEGRAYLTVIVEQEGEVIAEFFNEELRQSKRRPETIS